MKPFVVLVLAFLLAPVVHAEEPDGSAEHVAILRKKAERCRSELARAVRRYDAIAAKVGDGRRHERKRLAWETARDQANAWLFDEEVFPDPGDRVVTGPMEGYGAAKRLGDEAIASWKKLEGLLDRAVRPLSSLNPKKATALRAGHAEALAAFRAALAALPESQREGLAEPQVDPLAVLFVDLALGDFATVAEAYAGLAPGWRTLCLFHAYCGAIVAWNERRPFDMEKTALIGMQGINAYRRALGISPIAHNEMLVRAAFGHSEEMTKLGYFSHRSPTEGRKTKEERAALEGYTEQLVECITGAGGGMRAIEFWKYDGGHHRDMIHPKWKEGGFSTRGPSVYLGGAGAEGCIPGLRY